jgi:hypothetical protein
MKVAAEVVGTGIEGRYLVSAVSDPEDQIPDEE